MVIRKAFFITGTDTNVGKTRVAISLLKKLNAQGYSTVGLKPLSSGCYKTNEGLRNQDATALQQAASIKLPYEWVNPLAFEPNIAPHLAAQEVNVRLSVASLFEACEPALNLDPDVLIIEGAGGFLCPLNERETMADFSRKLSFPVILVVGMRLGCLNHSLLTCHSIHMHGLQSAGWVAHSPKEKMPYLEENISSLKKLIAIPYLGIHPDFQVLPTFADDL